MKNFKRSIQAAVLITAFIFTAKAQETPADVLGSILTEAANSYKWNFAMISPKASSELKYSDATVSFEFVPMDEKQLSGPYNLAFWITNTTASNFSINWENSYITSLSGKERPVYHGELKSISSAAQKNTLITAKQKVGDAVVPKESVITARHDGYWDDYGKWVDPWNEITGYQLFFGDDFPAERTYETVKSQCEGKTFKLHLVFVTGGTAKSYDFTFRVESIVKSASSEPNPLADLINQNK
jgi:hypothetical protein